jgi:hypothetical protein
MAIFKTSTRKTTTVSKPSTVKKSGGCGCGGGKKTTIKRK